MAKVLAPTAAIEHFWGSAQADLLAVQKTCTQYNGMHICIAYSYTYFAVHYAGTSSTLLSLPNSAVDFADYNDDGCTDILTATPTPLIRM